MTSHHGNFAAPADEAAAVTPSDTVDLAVPTRGLYVGGAGNLSVEMKTTGSAIVFTGVPQGSVLPIAVTRVNATLTTATAIVALF